MFQEVENLATLGVSRCLCLLDEYLWSGFSRPENEKCFDVSEANQWRELITEFGYLDRVELLSADKLS